MEIVELTIHGETFVGMNTDYYGTVKTTILEASLYGKTEFIKRKFFHQFTEDGPEPIPKDTMITILTNHREN